MAQEEKSQKVVETYKAVAAGIASVLAAVFTSGLGVAGTLIGTAVTAILITLGSAVFKAQLMKATDKISGLPDTVRGRFSTQQIRIPGKPNAEPNPEPAARPEATGKRRLPDLLSRLRAIPGFLRDLPSNQRRRVLVAGLLAGLLATAIGLAGVTGIELAGGKTLSCLVWSSCPDDDESGGSSGRRSGLSILGGYSAAGTGGAPSTEQPSTPGSDPQEAPQGPVGDPVQPGAGGGGTPPQPDADSGEPRQQPGQPPRDPEQPGSDPPGADEGEPAPTPDKAPEEGRSQGPGDGGSEKGQEKEDRGEPGPL